MGTSLLWFQDAEKELKARHQEELERLRAHKPLFQIAMEMGCRFSLNHDPIGQQRASTMTFSLGIGTINCLALDLRLGPNDSILKDVGPIVEALREHPVLEERGETEYLEMGWKGWDFRLKPPQPNQSNAHEAQLKVRVWFKNSRKCRLVGTGEYEEKMKLMCEE